ncbi:MAG TPA: hypothetical protein VKE27_12510 [Candidatus Dormibacteraeota bacterium]|nr:hypothetical protein [Candidatus Dormibacteraeota bacterium]
MRVLVGVVAVLTLLLSACRTMPDLSRHPSPSPVLEAGVVACPDGLPAQPGLTDFGAYIGTWQANHARFPKTSDYLIAADSGRVGVRCNAANYVIAEEFTLTFQVPGGRALQFALTDLPADSQKIYDHTHPGCRALQYRSGTLAAQLIDDHVGLVDITLRSSSSQYNLSAVSMVEMRVAGSVGGDSRPC